MGIENTNAEKVWEGTNTSTDISQFIQGKQELTQNQKYIWYVFVKDAIDSAKSDEFGFTTIDCRPLVYNSTTYKTVIIGNQCWTAKNLNEPEGGSKCYDNNQANCDMFGRLYNWDEANSIANKIDGWSFPSKDDWAELVSTLGGEAVAGDKMKEGGSSGFDALYGGIDFGGSQQINEVTRFWTSTPYDTPSNSWSIGIYINNTNSNFSGSSSDLLKASLRLLKD